MKYKYVPYQYTEYQYVLLYHNTPYFLEDGSPYSIMLYTRELYSHVIMQQDVGRTCNVGCTEICGFHPLKTIGKKTVDVATRGVKNSEENLDEDSPYVLVMVLLSSWLSLQFNDEVRSLCWTTTDGDDRSRL